MYKGHFGGESEKIIETLEAKVAQLSPNAGSDIPTTVYPLEGAKLYQNVPNPFSESTQIQYDLPEGTKKGEIFVFDMQGKMLTSISKEGQGRQGITLEANTFGPGIYLYSLVINGQEVDTKRMIITN